MKMGKCDIIGWILSIVGGIILGINGILGYDVVAQSLPSVIVRIVYVAIGVSAIAGIWALKEHMAKRD